MATVNMHEAKTNLSRLVEALVSGAESEITPDAALQEFAAAEFAILPIEVGHLRAYGALPALHGDPFDRLLVATAVADTWRLGSADRALLAYGDVVLPA